MTEKRELADVLNILHDDIERTNEKTAAAMAAIGAAMAASFQRFAQAMRKLGEAFGDPLAVGAAFALMALERHRVLLDRRRTELRRLNLSSGHVCVAFRLRAPFRWFPPIRRRLQQRIVNEVMRNFPPRLREMVYVWTDGGPIDTTPRPPFHYNCRCTTAPAPTEGEHDGE